MKATIIFGVLCCIVAVLSRKPNPTLRPYPVVFTATYNESDRADFTQAPRMKTIFLDVPNKRANLEYVNKEGFVESWKLIYRPKGADPNAPASNQYTLFNINADHEPQMPPNNCFYATKELNFLAPFPTEWIPDPESYKLQVGTWFNLPNDLVYTGPYFIAELGVMSDRWDSISLCLLLRSGIGQVPCTSVMFSQGQNPLPLMDIRTREARANTFDNDMYDVRVYHSFVTGVSDTDFALPNKWDVNCGNGDNDLITTPGNAVKVYSKDGPDARVTIKLAAPPVASLGNVKVYLSANPTWYYNCTDCLSFGVDHLTFNGNNWNVPQEWPFSYVHSGCSQYSIKATGGGYEWQYYARTINFLGCEGDKSKGCTQQPTCG